MRIRTVWGLTLFKPPLAIVCDSTFLLFTPSAFFILLYSHDFMNISLRSVCYVASVWWKVKINYRGMIRGPLECDKDIFILLI